MDRPIKGRGAPISPKNRFEDVHQLQDQDAFVDADEPAPSTVFLESPVRSVISTNDSPDLGMEASLNPYRGCEHGCIYCYARPTHEYFGLSAGLDFETKVFVKSDAPERLRALLSSPKWEPKCVTMSGVTDCYQPVEGRLKLTRRCLEVLAEFRNPAAIITKNYRVTRDIDVLSRLAAYKAAAVFLSVTTLDASLTKFMEPRTSFPALRLRAIEELAKAGIPVGVNVAPVIPGLTDHEIPAILKAAADAGARHAGYTIVRLPHAVAPLFEKWLEVHYPDRKEKILNRIRQMRDGKLYKSEFHSRMRGEGIFAEQIESLFRVHCRKNSMNEERLELRTDSFRRNGAQDLFN
jgi:DNA repair photolyase